MNKDIKMSVSSITRTGDKKAVYVFFQDVYFLEGLKESGKVA